MYIHKIKLHAKKIYMQIILNNKRRFFFLICLHASKHSYVNNFIVCFSLFRSFITVKKIYECIKHYIYLIHVSLMYTHKCIVVLNPLMNWMQINIINKKNIVIYTNDKFYLWHTHA